MTLTQRQFVVLALQKLNLSSNVVSYLTIKAVNPRPSTNGYYGAINLDELKVRAYGREGYLGTWTPEFHISEQLLRDKLIRTSFHTWTVT